jgi:hypothetical protein
MRILLRAVVEQIGRHSDATLNINTTDPVPRVDLGQTNIIYNIPHPSILLYILYKITGNILLLLIQDIKKDTVSYSEE